MKTKLLVLIIALFFILSGCKNAASIENSSYIISSSSDSSSGVAVNELKKVYKDESYSNSLIQINYPQFQTQQENYQAINEEIAAAIPAYVTATCGEDREGLTLEMDYSVYTHQGKWLSVVFEGLLNVSSATHPSNQLFSLNFDLTTGKRATLNDMIPADSTTIEKLRNAYPPVDEKTEWLQGISDEELLELLKSSDSLFGDTYSYISSEGLHISLPAPHAIGDHVEFLLSDAL